MKVVYFSALILLFTTSTYAQKGDIIIHPFGFSLGADVQVPIGGFSNVSSVGFGASLQGEYKVSSGLGLTLNAGYINFPLKSGGNSVGFVPVLAGAKIWLSNKAYFHGQLGVSLPATSGGSSNFTYSPGIGFLLGKNIDALLKYVGMTSKVNSVTFNYNSVGLRLAYNFTP